MEHVAHLYLGGRKVGIALIRALPTGWPDIILVDDVHYVLANVNNKLDEEGRHQARYTKANTYVVEAGKYLKRG